MEQTQTNFSKAGGVLAKASNLGAIGIALVAVAEVVYSILSLTIVQAMTISLVGSQGRNIFMSGFIFGLMIRIAIIATFAFLTFKLRKAKSKAISINLIVFGSIFGLTSLLQFTNLSVSPLFAIVGLCAVAGWVILLVAGIFGTQVSEAELEENRLA